MCIRDSSLSSPGLSYDTKFVHIGWELRSSLVGETILGVQSEPACIKNEKRQLRVQSMEWLKLNFASCVVRQTRSLGVLILYFIYNMVFVNESYDTIINTQFHRIVKRCKLEVRFSYDSSRKMMACPARLERWVAPLCSESPTS